MEKREPTREDLLEKIRTLEERLLESEQTIQAIQSGEVDALVIQKPGGEQLYTLTGADHGYRVLVESITEGALILSSDDSIYYCNRTLGEMLQLPIQKIVSKKLDSYVASEGREQLMALIEESRSLGTAKGEFLITRNDGTLLPVNVSLNCMSFEDFEGVCAVITDLTEQKQVEEELRRHRTELEFLVNERTADLQREIIERERAEEALRKSYDELELRVRERTVQLEKVNKALIVEMQERKRNVENVKAERQRFYEVLETLPVYVCLLAQDYHVPFANRVFRERFGESRGLRCFEHLFGRSEPCEVCDTYKVLKTMAPHQWEWIGPDSRNYSIFDFPFTDTDGSSIILEMGIDITERKQAEAELSTTITRLESMNQELQEFAFIASHDLQEPLRKIQAFGSMLITRHKDALNPQGQDYMGRITKAANRMSELLRSLLDYSRTGTNQLNYGPVSLTEVAGEAASDLEWLIHKAGGSVEIGKLPTVDADAPLLRQLFQNIIGNSIKYRKESEQPVVKIYGKITDATCQVMIEDNGIGFDERYSQKIFRPFERLHGKNAPYSGTGMGLAICKKIVDRHGGWITARSIPGQGATFIVALPAKQQKGA